MPPRVPVPIQVESLLNQQSGVISARQLVDADVSRRVIQRLTRGWTRVTEGIYASTELTWTGTLWSGLVRAGPDGVVGGAASSHLHGGVLDEPSTIHIWAPSCKQGFATDHARVVFRRGSRNSRGEPPRTALEESLLDLAADSASEYDVVSAVTRALSDRKTTPARITHELAKRKRQRHRALLVALCDASSAGIESTRSSPVEWCTRVIPR